MYECQSWLRMRKVKAADTIRSRKLFHHGNDRRPSMPSSSDEPDGYRARHFSRVIRFPQEMRPWSTGADAGGARNAPARSSTRHGYCNYFRQDGGTLVPANIVASVPAEPIL